jgi:protein arginine kinase
MNDLRERAQRPAPWLVSREATDRDIVLSSRVRLARNVEGWRFPHATAADELCTLREQIIGAAARFAPLDAAQILRMEDLAEIERRFLLERHLISVDLVQYVLGRGLVVTDDESFGLMLNEEDHIRLQSFAAGLGPGQALQRALAAVTELESELAFAFDPQLGYLTACPTNVGTGMRASVLLHLPALVLTQDAERVLNSLRRLGYTVRGFYGEGSGVMGALFQISNSATLGRAEEQIVEDLLVHVGKVIECEREARSALLERDRVRLEDRVWRSWGVLTHGRLLTTKEAFERLSDVRLGCGTGILPPVDDSVSNTLMMSVQGAHLQVGSGQAMEAPQRDEARARFVRDQLLRAVERNEER